MAKLHWGVHPVLEAALAFVDEDDVPAELERALPPRVSLSTCALVEIALVCIAHIRPRVTRAQRGDFERLAALVERQRASPEREPEQPWHRDLAHARRDAEHGRGAVKIAALAAEVAHADHMRSAPGAGVEAVALASETVQHTARALSKDRAALHAFVLALCARFR